MNLDKNEFGFRLDFLPHEGCDIEALFPGVRAAWTTERQSRFGHRVALRHPLANLVQLPDGPIHGITRTEQAVLDQSHNRLARIGAASDAREIAAVRESKSSFANDNRLIGRYLAAPRREHSPIQFELEFLAAFGAGRPSMHSVPEAGSMQFRDRLISAA
ncbi:MAG TPA: hypothetical protein VKG63_16315 [Steroidobacteraceae bacterium]|nr:hypothetical protein [Steroidobacteraceae bacterium]